MYYYEAVKSCSRIGLLNAVVFPLGQAVEAMKNQQQVSFNESYAVGICFALFYCIFRPQRLQPITPIPWKKKLLTLLTALRKRFEPYSRIEVLRTYTEIAVVL